jgi:chromosomal replication initiation ATPase DnaA
MSSELTPTLREITNNRRAFHASIAAQAAKLESKMRQLQKRIEVVEAKQEELAAPVVLPPLPEPDPNVFATPEDLGVVRDYPSVAKIQKFVCEHLKISRVELLSRSRVTKYVEARHLAFYLCRMLTPNSYPELGRRFGHMDHTSVLHGVVKVAARIEQDPEFAEEIKTLMDTISPEGAPPDHVVRSESAAT